MTRPENWSPRVAFGLTAMEVMGRARSRSLGQRDICKLMLATLDYVGDNAALRDAVATFVRECAVDRVAAAYRLERAVMDFVHSLPRADASEPYTSLFDWQKRVDLNG